jgi:hypothetical protein
MKDELGEVMDRLRQARGRQGDIAVPFGSFMRGLTIGALVGAAIAGSTIWNRRRGGRARPALEPGVVVAAPADPDEPTPT